MPGHVVRLNANVCDTKWPRRADTTYDGTVGVVQTQFLDCVGTTPQTEDYTAWAVAMVRTMLSAATTAQFLCLADAPRDRASNTRDWPFGADHTISRRTPDPSSRPSNPFLHLESTLDVLSTLEMKKQPRVSTLHPRVGR